MKRLTILLCIVVFLPVNLQSQTIFKGCAAEGRARRTKKNPTGKISANTKAQNRLKNRDDGPTPSQIDSSITLADLLLKVNNERFTAETGVEVTGYVVDVTPGGKQESCNCGRKDLQDIHIDIVLHKNQASNKRQHFIVEITPRFQGDLGGYKAVRKELKGKWVKFTGWLFYDSIHADEAQNTNPKGKNVWRKTAWEVHPVSAWKIVDEP